MAPHESGDVKYYNYTLFYEKVKVSFLACGAVPGIVGSSHDAGNRANGLNCQFFSRRNRLYWSVFHSAKRPAAMASRISRMQVR